METVNLFASLIAQRCSVLANKYSKYPAYDLLLKAGVIEETGVVSSLVCDACDQPHDAAIVYETGSYGYYCPDVGFVTKARLDLISTQPNLIAFTAQMADQLNCKRRKSTPLNGETWRIGALDSPAGDIALYFQPMMQGENDIKDFKGAMIGEMRSTFGIILTSTGTLSVPPYVTIQLQDVLRFDPKSGTLAVNADLHALAGVPVNRTGGRPSAYKEALTQIIANRAENGTALKGRNEEAKAVLAVYKANFPNKTSPALSSINRYVSEARRGS
ncbi:hypothetical protein DI396_06600 [Litorivita pollutaquae]|uniref:Uncharacterized protein n=1 Tax=Litorivita pollutaquae TaxID=2200892 RepID=A0A2V4MM51_9RHOB|nr:hypothetical protein [Litorivita pollutaquae]PYC47771.1 hypothetical protein DI396_06600 [Litorivita pollutaquae]